MSFDSDDSAALRMLMQFHECGSLREWLRAAFAFRLAYKERLEMFYDEKTGKIAQIVIDEILKLSLPELERLDQRKSISFIISSAQRIASAIALIVAGTRRPPSYAESFRAAKIAAITPSTRLRPSSIPAFYTFALFSLL